MKHPLRQILTTTAALCLWLTPLLGRAQDSPTDHVTVPFRDPARPGMVKVSLMQGGITVKGYDGKEVIVEARLRADKKSKHKERHGKDEHGDEAPAGLKRIEIGSTGLTVEEEDNVVTVGVSMGRNVDLTIQVPFKTSLKLSCMNDGELRVEKVEGEIEASNLNGSTILRNVSGVVIAHSLNGRVETVLDKVTPDKPMSFSTMNGDVDVTLPADIKAKVKLESENGAIYSDFDIGLDTHSNAPIVEDGRKEGGKYRIQFERGVTGTINGGGAEMKFKSMNGNIQIRKAKPAGEGAKSSVEVTKPPGDAAKP